MPSITNSAGRPVRLQWFGEVSTPHIRMAAMQTANATPRSMAPARDLRAMPAIAALWGGFCNISSLESFMANSTDQSSITLWSFRVGVAGEQSEGAVKLLGEDDAGKLVRHGQRRKRNLLLGRRPQRFGKSFGVAAEEDQLARAAVAPVGQRAG